MLTMPPSHVGPIQGLGLGFGAWGLGFRVWGLGLLLPRVQGESERAREREGERERERGREREGERARERGGGVPGGRRRSKWACECDLRQDLGFRV